MKTDRPYYYAGNTVLGKIYIRCEIPMQAKELRIKVKGKEKASFLRRETRSHTVNGETRTETIVHKEKMHKKYLEFDGVCFTFTQPLAPGDYIIPFEFTLPLGLPASIMFQNKHHHDKPKAIVKYSVMSTIINYDNTVLRYKQMPVIHEPPVAFQENNLYKQKVAMTTCCCCAQG